MKTNENDTSEDVPLREEPKAPKCKDQVKDEILFRKVIKPTGVAHAGEILKFM
jgi:hypothetical protein